VVGAVSPSNARSEDTSQPPGAEVSSPAASRPESENVKAVLQKERERIEEGNPKSPLACKVTRIKKAGGEAARRLFPRWEFYLLEGRGYKRPGFEDVPISIPLWLTFPLAVNTDSSEALRLSAENYGDLLRREKVAIKNADDAQWVWDAFCEICHAPYSKTRKMERVSENEWKLGIYSYDQTVADGDGVKTIVKRTHFMKVTTDPSNQEITGWQDMMESSEPRVERTP